jgi:hypothetical protein
MQSHRTSGPSRKARSALLTHPNPTFQPKPCHFDRSNRQPHRLLRSGETRFSTSTSSKPQSRFSLPAPLNRHPERSLSQSHRERRSRTDPEALNHPIPFRAFQPLPSPLFPLSPGAPFMQSHRMSGPSRKARSALLTQPKPCHFDRSNRQSHRLLRSGETRFSTSTPSSRKQPSLPAH